MLKCHIEKNKVSKMSEFRQKNALPLEGTNLNVKEEKDISKHKKMCCKKEAICDGTLFRMGEIGKVGLMQIVDNIFKPLSRY